MVSEAEALEALTQVIDPELGVDIVNLGLIYEVQVFEDGSSILAIMTLTTPSCPLSESMPRAAENVLLSLPGVKAAKVELVWSPPWDPSMISPVGRMQLSGGR